MSVVGVLASVHQSTLACGPPSGEARSPIRIRTIGRGLSRSAIVNSTTAVLPSSTQPSKAMDDAMVATVVLRVGGLEPRRTLEY